MTNMNELIEAMKKAADDGCTHFGIRVVDNDAGILHVGDWCPDSYSWDYELDCSTRETTGEALNGVCAVEIDTRRLMLDGDDDEDVAAEIEKAVQQAKNAGYWGEQMLLIAGCDGCEYGDDENEIIIENAKVIAIVEK